MLQLKSAGNMVRNFSDSDVLFAFELLVSPLVLTFKFIGSLARIGPNMLLTDDPVLLRRISASRSPYTKGAWYDGVRLDPDLNNTISEKDE
jgi:hypothetical protein